MQRFPAYPCPLRMHRLHHYHHPPERGTFVTPDESTLAPHNPRSLWCSVELTVGAVHSVGSDKCTTCSHQCSIMQSIFTVDGCSLAKKDSFQKFQKYVLPSVTDLERDVLFQLQFGQALVWVLTGSAQPT